MSAFLCSDRHIATIATAHGHLNAWTIDQTQMLADILKKENIRSVNYRYQERTRIKPCDLSQAVRLDTLMPCDIVALCECLDHQSCERPDYIGAALGTVRKAWEEKAARMGIKSALWSI